MCCDDLSSEVTPCELLQCHFLPYLNPLHLTLLCHPFPMLLEAHSASTNSLINITPTSVLAQLHKIMFWQGGLGQNPCTVTGKVHLIFSVYIMAL